MFKLLSVLLFLPLTFVLLGQELSNGHVVSIEIDSALIKNGLECKLFSYGLDTSFVLGAGESQFSFGYKTKVLMELELYILSGGIVSTKQLYSCADEVIVKVKADESEKGFNTIIRSKCNDQLTELYQKYVKLCKPTNLNFEMKPRDSMYMVGVTKGVLPEIRRATMKAYDSLVKAKAPPALLALLLNKDFDNHYYSFRKYSKVSDYYLAEFGKRIAYLDDLSVSSPQLLELKNNISRFNERSPRALTDFNIMSSDKTNVSLKRMAKAHKYVLVNVWLRSCGPCRMFNKAMPGSYDELKRLGVKIVNVNADFFESEWQEASETDDLLGVDGYTNANSRARYFYNPANRFPAKILFVNGTEVMAANTKSPAELVEQIKKLEGGYSD